jgi:hypothetical protein
MDWLEQNLDAYRIIAEILNDLREVLRAQLEGDHGTTWYKDALPNGLLNRLVEIKEKEKAIDWYESEYQQIMNYAVFPDLLQILEHNSSDFPHIMRLAPTTALLHARFLELEVMRSKLGRARPISETELAFLGTFHLRFRKAIDDFRSQTTSTRDAKRTAPSAEPPVRTATEVPPPVDQPTTEADLSDVDEPAPEVPAKSPPRRAASAVSQAAQSDTQSKPSSAPPIVDEITAVRDAEDPRPEDKPETRRGPSLDESISQGDSQAILRAIYQEVTNTAESIWSKDVLPTTKVWNKVRTSSWYEESFSSLGLKPVSDFYEIMSKVDKQMRSGVTKKELQEYLKDSNFAQTLLALRDLFQRAAV